MRPPKLALSRRRLLGFGAIALIAAPALRYAQLLWLDRALPPVAEPSLTFVNGWALDASDLADPADAASGER